MDFIISLYVFHNSFDVDHRVDIGDFINYDVMFEFDINSDTIVISCVFYINIFLI